MRRVGILALLLPFFRMACIPLKKVCPDHSRWRVNVRAVRFFERSTNEQPPKLSRFEFIMLDSENTAMEAVVPLKWIGEQRKKLSEDGVYTIQYFEVCNARAIYRPVDHLYMARFTKHTRIEQLSTVPPDFPLYACSITPFHVLRARVGVKEQMSDAMGLFTKCSRMTKQATKNGIQSLINVHITDGRDNAVLALWGSHAEKFDAQPLMEMSKSVPVVLLFVGVTSSTFDGRLTLQCSTTGTWYVNPALPETTLLQQSFGTAIGLPYWVGEQQGSRPQDTTVADLSGIDNPHEVEGNRYRVIAKIKELVPNEQWSYLACIKCKRTTRPNGDTYKCFDPECTGTSAIPRYKIAFLATDPEVHSDAEEKTIEIICFGAVADGMIGLPADSLMSLASNVQGYIPEQIKRLYGGKYNFNLSVPRGAVRRGRTSFRVDSLTRIIEVEKHALPEAETSIVVPSNVEGGKLPGASVDNAQADTPDANASTPPKDALDTAALHLIATPVVRKEKHPISEPGLGEDLEDTDCETSMPSVKKLRAARKLSMAASEEDE